MRDYSQVLLELFTETKMLFHFCNTKNWDEAYMASKKCQLIANELTEIVAETKAAHDHCI